MRELGNWTKPLVIEALRTVSNMEFKFSLIINFKLIFPILNPTLSPTVGPIIVKVILLFPSTAMT